MIELAALWKREGKKSGKPYWMGKLGTGRLLLFENQKANESQPDLKLFIVPDLTREETEGTRPPAKTEYEDDIPF